MELLLNLLLTYVEPAPFPVTVVYGWSPVKDLVRSCSYLFEGGGK